MYIAMFYLGVQASKYAWLDKLDAQYAFWGMLLWLLGKAVIGPIANGYGEGLYVISRGFTVIGMSVFLLYGFKSFFNNQNHLTSQLSKAAFSAIAAFFLGWVICKLPILKCIF